MAGLAWFMNATTFNRLSGSPTPADSARPGPPHMPEGNLQGAADRSPLIRRGAITITYDPIDVHWNGIRVSLSPLERRLFALVARRGRAPWAEIDHMLDVQSAATNRREVLLCRLRRKFTDIGAEDPLETVRGWGLRFRTEPDRRGSQTLWIGASERDDNAR